MFAAPRLSPLCINGFIPLFLGEEDVLLGVQSSLSSKREPPRRKAPAQAPQSHFEANELHGTGTVDLARDVQH